MNKPVPWNIKGVGFDAREAARLAARRAGVPLGDWLNDIISARAAELGVHTEDIEPNDRLEAIAARLSEANQEDGPEAFAEAQQSAWPDLRRTVLPPRGGMSTKTSPSREAGPTWAMSSQKNVTDAHAATHLNGIVQGRLGGIGPSIDVGQFELAEAEGTATARHATQPLGGYVKTQPQRAKTEAHDVERDPETLDTRLASILEKLNRSFEEAERLDEVVHARMSAEDSRPAKPAKQVRPPNPGLHDVERVRSDVADHQHSVSAQHESSSDDGTPDGGGSSSLPLREAPNGAGGYADLHSAFKVLAEKLEAQAAAPRASAQTRTPHNHSDRLDEQSRRPDRVDAKVRPEGKLPNRDVDRLRRDVGQLSARLADLAPQQTLAGLDSAVRDLTGRVDLSKLDGVRASVLAPVERLSREMREAIRAADPSKAVDALRRDMQSLADKVDSLQGREPDKSAAAALKTEIDETRRLVTSVADRLQTTERLQGEIVALSERVAELAQRTTPAMARDLGLAIADIRDLLHKLGSDGVLGAIDRKIESLTERVNEMADARPPNAFFDDLAQQIERAHETLATRLSRAPQIENLSGLEQQIGTLSAKIDSFGRTSHDVNALYGLVGGLADRIEEARGPHTDGEAMNALQGQIGQLMERLDRSEAGNTSFTGLERLIGDLFLQIELSRNVAIDAAENAARTAAQDTLRAAMDNPTLNGAELTVQTGLDVDHVSQELAELRRIQETSERRVTTTLTALNTTLERLVDRMIADRAAQTRATLPEADTAGPKNGRRRGKGTSDPLPIERGNRDSFAAFDPEKFLVEPGAGETFGTRLRSGTASHEAGTAFVPTPDVSRHRAEEPVGDVAPLIAAARRAAQAAQASALEASLQADNTAPERSDNATIGKTRSFFATRRRPLLLGLAGLVLLLGTLQIVRLSSDRGDGAETVVRDASPEAAPPAATDQPRSTPNAPAQSHSEAVPAKSENKGMSLLAPPSSPDEVAASFTTGSNEAGKAATPATSRAAAATSSIDPALSGLSPGLRDLATNGNAGAQFEIGVRLSDGRGVTRDAKQAASWFQRAAQQGSAPAQYRLGSLYEKGVGVAADPALAVAWYDKAAGQGNVRAMHNLAVMSAEGAGSKPDYAKAVTWFTKAASYGVRDSQFNLAVLFARGLGVPQNLGQSYAWFAIAAAQGDNDAVAKRDTVAAKLDSQGLTDAKAMVSSFHALVPDPKSNDVVPPPGGWDAVVPAKTASGKTEARVSSI